MELELWAIVLFIVTALGFGIARSGKKVSQPFPEAQNAPVAFVLVPVAPTPEPPAPSAPVAPKEPTPAGITYGKWPELVKAIIQVESDGYDRAIGDRNLTNKAYGCMQIRKPVCVDVNRVFGTTLTPEAMLGNRQLSIDTFYNYMTIYATQKQLARAVTHQDRARIWNGGPAGWKKLATIPYWSKVTVHIPAK